MPLIEGRDRVLYDQVIVEAELNVDDFEIILKRDSPDVKRTDSLPEVGTGTVTVTYKPTGIARRYRYDVVPPPEVQLEQELKVDIFKTVRLQTNGTDVAFC